MIRQRPYIRHVQRLKMLVPFDQTRETRVGQFGTIGEGKSLNPFALHKRLDGSITDFVVEGCQVQPSDHLMIWKHGILAEGGSHVDQVRPSIALWPMPQDCDTMNGPVVGDKHAASKVSRRGELDEHRYQKLWR